MRQYFNSLILKVNYYKLLLFDFLNSEIDDPIFEFFSFERNNFNYYIQMKIIIFNNTYHSIIKINYIHFDFSFNLRKPISQSF